MAIRKLNARQFKCLEEMNRHTGVYPWMPRTAQSLTEMAFVKPDKSPQGLHGYVITDAGREFLKGFPPK